MAHAATHPLPLPRLPQGGTVIVTHEPEFVDLAHWVTDDDDWETSPDAMHWTPEEEDQ